MLLIRNSSQLAKHPASLTLGFVLVGLMSWSSWNTPVTQASSDQPQSTEPGFVHRAARLMVQTKPSVKSRPQSRQLEIEPVTTWPSKSKRWALVIGVDKYKDPQISPLKGSDNDARVLADALVRYAGLSSDQVILLATNQPEERQPTRVNILRRLSNLVSVVPKDGLLLVSFAGHGMERHGQAYLLPTDAQISEDISFLEETAISVTRMKDRIRATGVGQVVVLLDACRNDPGGRADAPNRLSTAFTRGFNFDVRNREVQAFATLYATAVGQRAYEYTERKQGYFTWAVVEGLKGGAANEKGEVTLAGLVRFIQETVPKRIGIDLGGGKQQKPFAVIEGYRAEDLVISVNVNVTVNRTNNQPSSTGTQPVDPATFELAYWDAIKNSNDAEDFKAYLEKYPTGQFTTLANNRINSIEESAKPAEPTPSRNGSATELAFWDSIKNSTNPEDFKLYIKNYPSGAFVELANARLVQFERDAKEAEQKEASRRKAEEFAKISVVGTTWQGRSVGGGTTSKQYVFSFRGNGVFQVIYQSFMEEALPFFGTWTQDGTKVHITLANPKDGEMSATINGSRMEGEWNVPSAKHKIRRFAMQRVG